MSRLRGCVVATTRDGRADDPLRVRLVAERARVVSWPTLSFAAPSDPAPLHFAARAIEEYDWVVFTSARAVEALGRAVVAAEVPTPRVAAVGTATARAAREAGWRVDVVGSGGARSLAAALARRGSLARARVLFPAASLARRALEHALEQRGARVDRVEAYRTVPSTPEASRVRADLAAGVDVVTFASPSAVHALAESVEGSLAEALRACGRAAIGTTTARALRAHGIDDVVVATRPGVAELVDACVFLVTEARHGP